MGKTWEEQKAWFDDCLGPVQLHFSTCPETRAVYFRLRAGKVAHSEPNEGGTVVVDYDEQGRFIGVEVLDCTAEEFNPPARQPAPQEREETDGT